MTGVRGVGPYLYADLDANHSEPLVDSVATGQRTGGGGGLFGISF